MYSKEYAKINPLKQIPAIEEIDVKTGESWSLGESHAIMRYLAATRNVPENFYPKDNK